MRDARWIKCTGEAHSSVYIDACGRCAPHWGEYPACPDCGCKVRTPVAAKLAKSGRCVNSACASFRRQFALPPSPALVSAKLVILIDREMTREPDAFGSYEFRGWTVSHALGGSRAHCVRLLADRILIEHEASEHALRDAMGGES